MSLNFDLHSFTKAAKASYSPFVGGSPAAGATSAIAIRDTFFAFVAKVLGSFLGPAIIVLLPYGAISKSLYNWLNPAWQ